MANLHARTGATEHRNRSTAASFLAGVRAVAVLVLTPAFAFCALPADTQQPAARAVDPTGLSPHEWAARAASHELEMIQFSGVYVRYRIHQINIHGDQFRDVLESRDGTVARLIYKENRPLTPEEDQAEHERLQAMLNSPAAFAKHVRGDVSGKKLAVDLVKLMPDAMIFTYVPGQPQTPTSGEANGVRQVVLDFSPNPAWHPPTMSSEALTGLRGRIWVDPRSGRMVRLDAELFQGVNFGWGMLAHLYPGGHFILEQVSVPTGTPDQRWIFSHFNQHVTVRALMVKTMKENSEIGAYDFQVVKPMSYQEAIHVLLNTPLPAKLP